MQAKEKIIKCYNKTAEKYNLNFADELSKKPFDRLMLEGFAFENKDGKRVADLGCGPGQTTKFLKKAGITNVRGIDISPVMIKKARSVNPGIKFETGDMLALKYKNEFFDSAIAFYAIVNFDYKNVKKAFEEINRVLKQEGQFLFSFHIGEKKVHLDSFLNENVDIDFYFFNTDKIINLLKKAGFKIITAAERYPYENIEYPSKRAYILAGKTEKKK